MTFNDTFDSHPTTFDWAVNLDGFNCVGGTAWPEAAAWAKQWTNHQLIKAHQTHHHNDDESSNDENQPASDAAND